MPRWRPGSLRPIWKKALDRTITLRGKQLALVDVICDPAWFWQVFGTYEDEPVVFDDWQVRWLHDHSRLRAVEKAPQIGYSLLTSAEALWDALLHLDATSSFVSVDQREAANKILYALKLYSGLPGLLQDWVPLAKDSIEELWFGERTRPSQLLSLPNTSAMRGRNMSVYLDESDFYQDGGVSAHRAMMGRLTRGGRGAIGSTCWGEATQLDLTMQNPESNFSKSRLPHVVAQNPTARESIEIARTELDPADFAEEYDCIRGGRHDQTFSAELLRAATLDESYQSLDLDDLTDGMPMVAGFDPGGAQHPAVLSIIRRDADAVWRQIVLMEIRGRRHEENQAMLEGLLDRLSTLTVVIDQIGVGRQTAESLAFRYRGRVISMQAGSRPQGMPSMEKHQLVIEIKKALESGTLKLLNLKTQTDQFRYTKLHSGGSVEQKASRSAKSHFDMFWSDAYCWYGALAGPRRSVYNDRDLIIVGG